MTEIEFIKEKIVDVSELEIQKSYNEPDKVARIKLITNVGNITFKPFRYINESKMINGFKVKQRKRELLTITELPKNIWDLNEKLKKGLCKVKLSYFLWNKDVDGKVMVIRFMKEKHVNEMEFLEMEEKVE